MKFVPRSIPRTAEAACAVEVKRTKRRKNKDGNEIAIAPRGLPLPALIVAGQDALLFNYPGDASQVFVSMRHKLEVEEKCPVVIPKTH